MAEQNYEALLNAWHLELAIVQDAFDQVVIGLTDETKYGSIAHVLSYRFHELVETCPFPNCDMSPLKITGEAVKI